MRGLPSVINTYVYFICLSKIVVHFSYIIIMLILLNSFVHCIVYDTSRIEELRLSFVMYKHTDIFPAVVIQCSVYKAIVIFILCVQCYIPSVAAHYKYKSVEITTTGNKRHDCQCCDKNN